MTKSVTKEVGAVLEEADHTNVYGISIYYNDSPEMCVTRHVPGDVVENAAANLIKLTTGYSSGVVGVAEPAARAKSTSDNPTY